MLIRVWRIVSKGVEFMFEYTVPPITAEKWSPLKTSISLFICPWIFIFNQGGTVNPI